MKSWGSYLLNVTKTSRHSHLNPAFTIIELLVVIVVIGVLAAITIVSYTGVTNKAALASLQSDLSSASTKLKAYQTIYGSYPTLDTNNCPSAPTVDNDYCLKFSPGNTIAVTPFAGYVPNNSTTPQTFSLTLSSNGIQGVITDNSKPSILTPAPLNPVADWIATPQGDHYGNYYDTVTKTWATVTRTTPKTIYDPTTQHIYDVPANKLGINPRSDGKNGFEAVIEESRTNYLLNSDISSSYGFGFVWTSDSSSPSITRGLTGTFRQTMGRWSWNPAAVSKAANLAAFSSAATFAEGNYAVASVYIEDAIIPSGANVVLRVVALNSSGTILATLNTNIPNRARGRYYIASNALPFSTDKVEWEILASNNSVTGQEIRVDFTAAQIEKGAFATSYIPTTTTIATRERDYVSVPDKFSPTSGSILITAKNGASNKIGYLYYRSGVDMIVPYRTSDDKYSFYVNNSGGYREVKSVIGILSQSRVVGGTFSGSTITGFVDGSSIGSLEMLTPINSTEPTAWIGGMNATNFNIHNGPISRVTLYSSALTSSDILTVSNAIKDGPQ